MDQAKIEVDRVEGDVAILKCAGWLETQAAGELKKTFENLLQERGLKKIVVDLSKVDYINSAALGTLLHYGNLARDGGGSFVFCGLKRNLHRVFDLVGLGRVFPRVDRLEDALIHVGLAPPKPQKPINPPPKS